MKQNRILSLVLAGALALNLAACGAPSGSTARFRRRVQRSRRLQRGCGVRRSGRGRLPPHP